MPRAWHMLRKDLGILSAHLQALQEGKVKIGWTEAAFSTLTCACDKCHKVFKAFSLAKLPFCQGGTVAIIVYPHGEMQSVRQGASEVHRVPFLNQFGWMQHNSFPRIYTATCRNAWAPQQNTRKIILLSNLRRLCWLSGLRTQIIHPRSPKTNITKDCKVM